MRGPPSRARMQSWAPTRPRLKRREAAAVAKDLYLSGVLPYLNLLSAQQALQQAELTLVTSQRNRLAAHVEFQRCAWCPLGLSRNTSHSKPEGVR